MFNKFVDFLKYNDWFALQKFRFDLGLIPLPFINLILLVIGVVDYLNEITGLSVILMTTLLPPLAIFGTWLFGYILDSLRFQHNVNENIQKRNPQIQKLLEMNEEILEKLQK